MGALRCCRGRRAGGARRGADVGVPGRCERADGCAGLQVRRNRRAQRGSTRLVCLFVRVPLHSAALRACACVTACTPMPLVRNGPTLWQYIESSRRKMSTMWCPSCRKARQSKIPDPPHPQCRTSDEPFTVGGGVPFRPVSFPTRASSHRRPKCVRVCACVCACACVCGSRAACQRLDGLQQKAPVRSSRCSADCRDGLHCE